MKLVSLLVLGLLVTGCTSQAGAPASTDWKLGAMAATANPYATDAAAEMLAAGGHAVDAAIAAHLVLGLVEPQSSGIGGGGFMLVYGREGDSLSFLDGRETAPAGATIDMFMPDGEPLGFIDAKQSGRAVGVPGAFALYEEAHQRFGRLPWADLFAPAIKLADEGFIVSPRMAGFLDRFMRNSTLATNPGAGEYFFPGGEPLKAGDLRKNPEYADTLRRVASDGARVFYTGEIAADIVAATQAPPLGGTMTLADIENYSVAVRPVICGGFRDYRICTTTPPSSGGAQIAIANLYDNLGGTAQPDETGLRAFVDAQRLAYADRDHYFADPDRVAVPLEALVDPRYLEYRASQRFAPAEEPVHGDPATVLNDPSARVDHGEDTTVEGIGTSHLSIIDSDGNAVSFTATVESFFGSNRWVRGFVLNNELTDFARTLPADGKMPANVVAPGRRPRSSMSPTMVFDDNGLKLITGSPGGNSIPAYTAKSMVGVLAWGMGAQEAVDYPNIIARGKRVRVETGGGNGAEIANIFKEAGYDVWERDGENSGIHMIVVHDDRLEGAADSRREGTVRSLP